MESRDENTSFQQFKFCPLCRFNHKRGKKHIYSKHHQTVLTNVVKKFSSKIQQAKETLFAPKVQESSFEAGAKFWCYFCAIEAVKHTVMEDCTIVGGGLLEHITSNEHKANMEQFFWDNLMKKDSKHKFALSLEDLCIFKKAAFLAVKKKQKVEGLERKQLAAELQQSTERREARLFEALQSEGSVSASRNFVKQGTNQDRTMGTRQEVERGTSHKRTVSAKADGLTCVSVVDQDKHAGNVHSGATPPWLLPDDGYTRVDIGPTLDDYTKHLQQEKKARLPANRVGAKFDHNAEASQDWLPSFGRVWGKGRRLQSKQHFEKNWKKSQFSKDRRLTHSTTPDTIITAHNTLDQDPSNMDTPTSFDNHCQNNTSSLFQPSVQSGFNLMNNISPYKRKRVETQTSETITVNGSWTTKFKDASSTRGEQNIFLPGPYTCNTSYYINPNVPSSKGHMFGYNARSNDRGSGISSSVTDIENQGSEVSMHRDNTSVPVVPYKRQKQNTSGKSVVNLIQTPVLFNDA